MKITDFGIAVLENDSHLSKWILEQRRLDVDGTARELAARFIKPGDVAVDGGASLGDHTTVYLDAVGATGTVHAFEPNPYAFRCLQHNCPTAIAWCSALGRASGNGKLIRDGDNELNFGASFVQEGCGQLVIFPLDGFKLSRLNFLKLDIEGMEYDALCGAKDTINNCRPFIMAEINHRCMARRGVTYEMIDALMKNWAYRMELLDSRYGLEREQTDVLFLPNEHH